MPENHNETNAAVPHLEQSRDAFSVLLDKKSEKKIQDEKIAEVRGSWDGFDASEKQELVKFLVNQCSEKNVDPQKFIDTVFGHEKVHLNDYLEHCYDGETFRTLKIRLNDKWCAEIRISIQKSELLGDACSYQVGLISYQDDKKSFDYFNSDQEIKGGPAEAHNLAMKLVADLQKPGAVERREKELFPKGRKVDSFQFTDEEVQEKN